MRISMIVAAAQNNAIGLDNRLLWHLPNDLKFFKNATWALPVIMGRKTLEALSGKPLNGRMNIVITRQDDFAKEGFLVADKPVKKYGIPSKNQAQRGKRIKKTA